jgi:hypothetical protein
MGQFSLDSEQVTDPQPLSQVRAPRSLPDVSNHELRAQSTMDGSGTRR